MYTYYSTLFTNSVLIYWQHMIENTRVYDWKMQKLLLGSTAAVRLGLIFLCNRQQYCHELPLTPHTGLLKTFSCVC